MLGTGGLEHELISVIAGISIVRSLAYIMPSVLTAVHTWWVAEVPHHPLHRASARRMTAQCRQQYRTSVPDYSINATIILLDCFALSHRKPKYRRGEHLARSKKDVLAGSPVRVHIESERSSH